MKHCYSTLIVLMCLTSVCSLAQNSGRLPGGNLSERKTGVRLSRINIAGLRQRAAWKGEMIFDTSDKNVLVFDGNDWRLPDGTELFEQTSLGEENMPPDEIVLGDNPAKTFRQMMGKGRTMLPLLTTDEIAAKKMSPSQAGLMVYNTTEKSVIFYNGEKWQYGDGLSLGQRRFRPLNINDKTAIPTRAEYEQLYKDGKIGRVSGMVIFDTAYDSKAYEIYSNEFKFIDGIPVGNRRYMYPKNKPEERTSEEILGILNPLEGMQVFDKEENKLAIYNGKEWVYQDKYKLVYKKGDLLPDGSIVIQVKRQGRIAKHGTARSAQYYSVYMSSKHVFSSVLAHAPNDKIGKISTDMLSTLNNAHVKLNVQYNSWYSGGIFDIEHPYKDIDRSAGDYDMDFFDNQTTTSSDMLDKLQQLRNSSGLDNKYNWYIPAYQQYFFMSIPADKDAMYLSSSYSWMDTETNKWHSKNKRVREDAIQYRFLSPYCLKLWYFNQPPGRVRSLGATGIRFDKEATYYQIAKKGRVYFVRDF